MKKKQEIREEDLRFLGKTFDDILGSISTLRNRQFDKISKGCKYAKRYDRDQTLCEKTTDDTGRNTKGWALFCRYDNCPFI